MKTSSATPLADLARELGVQTTYEDAFGTVSGPAEASLLHIMRALGAEIDSDDAGASEIADALAGVRARAAARLIEPVVVVWDGAATSLPIVSAKRRKKRVVLTLEDGEVRELAAKATDRTIELPAGLPHGYHRLAIEQGDERAEAVVISAPSIAAQPGRMQRSWGAFAPVYALRSERNWGVGDLGDAAQLARTIAGRGGALVGSTPLLPTFLDELFEPSPYSPVSRLAWNEIFLDVEALPEVRSGSARKLATSSKVRAERDRLRSGDIIDYRGVAALKRRVLEAAVAGLEPGGARANELDAWLAANPRIADYAQFRAATEQAGVAFSEWRAEARDGVLVAGRDFAEGAARYHEYVQWCMHEQIGALASGAGGAGGAGDAAGLYLDLPVGVHGAGYDAWRFRDLFATGVAVGAPPDPLGPDGQNWALPPITPAAARATGHEYFIECIQHLFHNASAVRIDHVMGLHRLFFIPEGAPASEGAFVSYPQDEMWAIVCLESHRNDVLLVGEDLGTVPEGTRIAMEQHQISRSYVLEFELTGNEAAPVHLPAANMLATLDTHDTETVSAWWERQNARTRQHVAGALHVRGLLDNVGAPTTVEATTGLLHLLAASDAQIVVATLEALWGETDPQNIPATTSEQHPNWRRRFAVSLEQIATSPEIGATFTRTTELRAAGMPAPDGGVRGDDAPPASTSAPVGRIVHPTREQSRITDTDLYLLDEGTHSELHRCLGSHPCEVDGVSGVMFAVWAPNAERVSVIGDFNYWQPAGYELAPLHSSGLWEGFVPGLGAGEIYKYHIVSREGGYTVEKADPLAQRAEVAPATGSIVHTSEHAWGDDAWMRDRGARNALDAPMSVYELHVGSWARVPEDGNRSLTYRELAPKLVDHVRDLGFTHVEFMPLTQHPFSGSWGYQTTGYFAAHSEFGSPDDLKFLIDELHRAGIGVIFDWVPSHFPEDQFGLAFFDGTHLYEHADPRQGFHPDWKSCIFNYSRSEVRAFLISSALYWLTEYHVDALRVDAVASMLYLDYSREEGEWVPNEHGGRENLDAISLLRRINEDAYARVPGAHMIAEESTSWGGVSRPTSMGGLGFGLKWDMGWMHDTLQFFGRDPIHRSWHMDDLTFRALYAFTENFMLPLSHDEVVHGKGSIIGRMPGDDWQKFANVRLLYSYMYGLPGKQLLFMGCEFAQWDEWNHEASLDWHLLQWAPHQGVQATVRDLNRLHREQPALHELDCEAAGFQWVHVDADAGLLSFLRFDRARQRPVLVVINTTPTVREGYGFGVPQGGRWLEIFNGDAVQYGGSGVGNYGSVEATGEWLHDQPDSVRVNVPPLAALMFTPDVGAGS